MNLYELFDTATDNLAELPDLAPAAERIVRRRRIATRSFSAACAAALIIGVGTLTLHPNSPLPSDISVSGPCSSTSPSAAGAPDPRYSLPSSAASGGTAATGFSGAAAASGFPQQAAQTLTSLWPVSCSTVVPAGGIYPATDVERYQAYEVVSGNSSFPLVLRFDEGAGALAIRQSCPTYGAGSGACVAGVLNDGDPYYASFTGGYGILTFTVQEGPVAMEVTLLEFDRFTDEITLPQLEQIGDSALMEDLVSLAIADEVPADNGITLSGLAAEASAVQSQSAN